MKKEKSLSELFEQARRAQGEVPVSEVKSLLESGSSSPLAAKPSFRPRRIIRLFNPLKLIVMITPIVITTALYLFTINTEDVIKATVKPYNYQEESDSSKLIESQRDLNNQEINSQVGSELGDPQKFISTKIEYQGDTDFVINNESTARQVKETAGGAEITGTILELNQEISQCLGLFRTEEGYELPTKTKNGWASLSFRFNFRNRGPTIGTSNCSRLEHPEDSPIIIGASRSNSFVQFPRNAFIDIPEWLSNKGNWILDICIPVRLMISEIDSVFRNPIIWIYPNEKFFSCLPPDIAQPMRMEFNYQLKRLDPNFVPQMGGSIGIGGGQPAKDTLRMGGSLGLKGGGLQKDSGELKSETVPCIYFTNLCETLSGLEYINLYPNPATSQITVDLVLQKAKKLRFRVYDMSGKLISGEETPQNYPDGGRVTHSVDISNLTQGFYLMVMTDEEGQRVTRRFVKN